MSLKKIYTKDISFVSILLVLLIIIRYLIPFFVGNIILLFILIILFYTKKDEIWIPFIFYILSAPGYLFYLRGNYHLPFIGISGSRGINYDELVIVVLFLKSFKGYAKVDFFYKRVLLLIILYTFILWVVGFYFGLSLTKVLFTIRYLIPFTLFWSIPVLINKNEKVYRALNLIFVFSIIAFAFQMFDILYGKPFSTLLGERNLLMSGKQIIYDNNKVYDVTQEAVRSLYAPYFLTISYITSLYLLINKKVNIFNVLYLFTVFSVSYISVIFSATRGWIIAYTLVFISIIIIKPRFIKQGILGIFLVMVLIFTAPILKTQLHNVYNRLSKIESIASGDLTAGGTLSRVTERGPRVMSKFKESPFLGFGYSNEFYRNADGHVGNQNLLLNSGILGFIIYTMFWVYYLFYIYEWSKYENSLLVFAFGLIALLFIHTTSAQIFSYYFKSDVAFGLAFLFFISDYFIKVKRKELKQYYYQYIIK